MQAACDRRSRPSMPSEPSRRRLDKRAWRDIRRARALGDDGCLYAVELHGVKMFYRWTVPHDSPLESKGGTAGSPTRTPAKERSTNARSEPTAAPKKPNHRQRRSTARLLDYMRTKTGSHGRVAAAASDATNSPTANPRAELSARARGGANASESTPSEPRGGLTAGERACEDNHASQLYAAAQAPPSTTLAAVVATAPVENDTRMADVAPARAEDERRGQKRAADEPSACEPIGPVAPTHAPKEQRVQQQAGDRCKPCETFARTYLEAVLEDHLENACRCAVRPSFEYRWSVPKEGCRAASTGG